MNANVNEVAQDYLTAAVAVIGCGCNVVIQLEKVPQAGAEIDE